MAKRKLILSISFMLLTRISLWGGILHVSTVGNDSLNNCTIPALPCATIQHAINQASSGDVVKVAQGTYNITSPITLKNDVEVLGGYDATFIFRNPTTNITQIEVTGASTDRAIVADNTITSNATKIDGFTILAGNEDTNYAIYIDGGKPTIRNNIIKGGNGGNTSQYGIFITGTGAHPVITNNTIYGNRTGASLGNSFGISIDSTGSPTATITQNTIYGSETGTSGNSYGIHISSTNNSIAIQDNPLIDGGTRQSSYGIYLTGGAQPTITSTVMQVIKGGSGSSDQHGIYVTGTGTNPTISNSTIYGNNTAATTGNSVGVTIDATGNPSATITQNTIYGSESGTSGSSTGVRVLSNNTTVRISNNSLISGGTRATSSAISITNGEPSIDRNRIYGGTGSNLSRGILLFTSGTNTRIFNNLIHGGGITGANTRAIEVSSSSRVQLYHNTIYAGSASATTRTGVFVNNSSTGVDIRNNIIFCANVGTEYGIRENSATSDPAIVQNNNIFRCVAGGIYFDENTTAFTKVSQLAALGWSYSGNIKLDLVSGGYFFDVDGADNDMDTLLDNNWNLVTNVPAILGQGGQNLSPTVINDFLGVGRTADITGNPPNMNAGGYTIGAYENNNTPSTPPTTFYSRISGNWQDIESWSAAGCGGVETWTLPVTGSAVIICNGHNITQDIYAPLPVGFFPTFIVQDGATLTASDHTLRVTSFIVVDPTATLSLSGTHRTVFGGGNGNIDLKGKPLRNAEINSTGTHTLQSALVVNNDTGATNAFLLQAGTLDLNSHNLSVSQALNINGGILNATSSTISIGASFYLHSGSFNAGTSTVVMNTTGSAFLGRSGAFGSAFTGSNKLYELQISAGASGLVRTSCSNLEIDQDLEVLSGTFSLQDTASGCSGANRNLSLGKDLFINGGTFVAGNTANPANTISIGQNLNLQNGTANLGNSNFQVAQNILLAGGTLNQEQANISLGLSWDNTGATFVAGPNPVTFTGSMAAQTIATSGQPFNHVVIHGTGSWELSDDFTATGDLSILDGTLSSNSKGMTIGGSLTIGDGIGAANSATFNGTNSTISVGANWTRNPTDGRYQRGTGNWVNLSGNGSISHMAGPLGADNNFWNITVAYLGKTTTLNTQVNVENQIQVGEGSLNMNGQDLWVYYQGGPSLPLSRHSAATFSGGGQIVYTFQTDNNGKVAGGNFGSTTVTVRTSTGFAAKLDSHLTTTGNFLVYGASAGHRATLDLNGKNVTAASLALGQGASQVATLLTGNSNVTLSGDLVIGNQTTAGSGNTLTTTGGTWSIGGNFTNNVNMGTVNFTGSTFVLNGTANQSINGTSPTIFHNLTLANSGARTITFPASMTHTVIGTFSATGSAGNVITLRSSTAGTQTTITVNGSLGSFTYLDIRDHVLNGTAVTAAVNPPNSTDSGNNVGWFSVGPGTLYSLATGNWNDATKWTLANCTEAIRPPALTVPSSIHDVVICNGDEMTVSTDVTVNSLTINWGKLTPIGSRIFTTLNNLQVGDGVGGIDARIENGFHWLNVGGSFSVKSDGHLGSRYVDFTGSGSHTVEVASVLHYLQRARFSGSGTYQLLSNLGVTAYSFELASGAGIVDLGNHTLEIGNASIFLFGGSLTTTGTGKVLIYSGNGQIHHISTTVNVPIEVNSTGNYQLYTHFVSSKGITKDNTGTFDLNGKNLTAASFDLKNGTVNQGSGIFTINGNYTQTGGTFNAFSGTTVIAGNFTKSGGTFNADTGLVRFTGSGAHTINNNSLFHRVEINATGSYTLANDLTVISDLTLNSGTLNTSASDYPITAQNFNLGGGSLVLNNSVVNVYGSWNNTGTTVTLGSGTVNFLATMGTPSIKSNGQNFPTVVVNAAAPITYTLQDPLSASFLSLIGGTLNTGTNHNITIVNDLGFNGGNLVANASTITFTGMSSIWNRASGVFTPGTSTVRFNTSVASNIVNDETFYNLEANNNALLALPMSTTIQNHFTIANSSSVSVPNNGTLIIQGNLNKSSTGTLDLGGAGGSATVTINGNLAVTGGDIEARGSTINIKGNLNLSGGTFVPGTSTVNLNGSSNQAITGSWNFYNLELATATGGKTITFPAGSTVTVSNDFQASGSSGNILTLNSSVLGSQATVTVNGPAMVPANYQYLAIRDHILNGSARTVPINPANSTNLGNTKGWFNASNLYTRASGNWSNGSIWSEDNCGSSEVYGASPLSTTDVVICSTHDITVDMAGDAKDFSIDGGSLVVSGGDLTVHGDFWASGGTVSIGDNRKLFVRKNFHQLGGTIQNTGMTFNGEFILAAIVFPGSDYSIYQSGGSFSSHLVIDSTHSYRLTNHLNAQKLTKNGSGTFSLNGYDLNLSGVFTINAGQVYAPSGNINLTSDLVLVGGTLNLGNSTLTFSGALLDLSGGSFLAGTSKVQIGSAATLNGGASFYDLVVFSGASLNMNPINRTVSGTFLIMPMAGTINIPNNTNFTVENFLKTGGNLVIGPTGDATLIVNGGFDHTGGTITASPGDTLRIPNALGTGIASRISLHKDNTYSSDIPDDPTNYGYLFNYHKVHVKVRDPSRNLNASSPDTLTVTITSTGGENETITLTETGNSTGVFTTIPAGENTAYSAPTASNGTVEGLVDEVLSLNYIDSYDSLDNHTSNTYDTRLADGSVKRWVQSGGGDWHMAGHWYPPGVPTATDKVILDNLIVTTPYMVSLSGVAHALDFTLKMPQTLALSNHTLNVHGHFKQEGFINATGGGISFMGSGGPYEIYAGPPIPTVNIGFNSASNYTIKTSLTCKNFTKFGAGTITLEGNILTIQGDLQHFSGGFNFADKKLVVSGNIQLSSTYQSSNSTVQWHGSGSSTLTATSLYHLIISGSGSLTLPNGSQLDILGDFQKSDGTFILGPSDVAQIHIFGNFEHTGGAIIATSGDKIRGVNGQIGLYKKNFTMPLINSPFEQGYYPTQNIEIRLRDPNRNLNNAVQETITVALSTSHGEFENLVLEETAAGSGVFQGVFPSFVGQSTPNDGQIHFQDGDILYVTYEDSFDPVTPDRATFETKIGPSVLANAKLTPDSAKIADNYFDFRFKRRTFLGFNLSKAGKMVIELYDLKGRKVKTLAEGNYEEGDNFLEWDVAGSQIPSGLYFLYFKSPNWRKTVMYQIMVVR